MASTSTQITSRKSRWLKFYNPESSLRRLFLITLPDDPDVPRKPLLWPELADARVKWGIQDYQRQIARLEWLDDDSLPFLDNITGTEIFAEALGCAVSRPQGFGGGSVGENMPFALHCINRSEEVDRIEIPEINKSSLQVLFDIADGMKAGVGEDALMRLVDIQSPMDIVSLIWEKTELFMAMLEEPEAVNTLSGKACSLLTAFCDEWFRRYGREGIAHFPTYYAPHGFTLSEDEIGTVSPRMFGDLFAPELQKMSDYYGGFGMHCCADSRHQWDNFKNLDGLQMLNIGKSELAIESVRYFADHVPMIPQIDWLAIDQDPINWFRDIPPQTRLVVMVCANGKEHAKWLSERLRKACDLANR